MKNLKVGLQLYTVAEAMNADMDAALKRVKEIGYDSLNFLTMAIGIWKLLKRMLV